MKVISFLIAVLCSYLLSIPMASAIDYPPDLSLPHTEGGITYTEVISWDGCYGSITFFYNIDPAHPHPLHDFTTFDYLSMKSLGWLRYWPAVGVDSSGDNNAHSMGWGYFGSSCRTNIHTSQPIYGMNGYEDNDSTVVVNADLTSGASHLTIVVDPLTGGNVTGDGISCNVDENSICTYPVSQVVQKSLAANQSESYAFGYWMQQETPHALTLNGTTTITAKFFRTFRDATDPNGEGLHQSSGYYGQCLPYVEYEVEADICSGYAVNCFAQANVKGYATGSTPKPGAIVVFAKTSTMNSGHIGIVVEVRGGEGRMTIHDANWCDGQQENCGMVEEHDVDIDSADILGYIYPTP
jgi:surface antigen